MGLYVINLNQYVDIATDWIALYALNKILTVLMLNTF